MELKERLKLARKNKGMTQTEVADKSGLTQATYSQLERGIVKSTGRIVAIANTLQVNIEWLATGEGQIPTNRQQVDGLVASLPLDDDEAEIPFYKDIAFACGHGAINDDVTHEIRKLRMGKRTLSNLGVMSENAFAVTARDDSMMPYVQDGDTIYIDKGRKEVKDGRIFAIRFGELCLCKRLYRLPDGGVRIVSDNAAEFPEQVATKQQISDGEFEVLGWVWSVSRLERW